MAKPGQDEWIGRVLGITAPRAGGGTGTAFPASWDKAAKTWQSAIEKVDGQISKLQDKLRDSPNPQLQGIAERGMNDITGNYKVKMMAAVRNLADADQQRLARLGPAVSDLIGDFQDFLDKDVRVALCDKNPFGVPIGMRDTLGPALAALADALKQSGAAIH